jgi:alpha-galactosidase
MKIQDEHIFLGVSEWSSLIFGPLSPILTVDREVLRSTSCESTHRGKRTTLRFTFSRPGIEIVQTWETETKGALRVRSGIVNRTDGPICLNAFTLMDAGGNSHFGEAPERCRVYEERSGYYAYVRGFLEPMRRQAMTIPTGEATDTDSTAATTEHPYESASQGIWVVHNPTDGYALAVGCVTFHRWLGMIRTEVGDGRVVGWRITFDGGDTLLDPGVYPLEDVVFLAGQDPWGLLERYGDIVQREYTIVPLSGSPVSWCSWYPYRLTVSEERVIANARIAAERLKPLGLSIIEVDLGWEDRYLPNVVTPNDQFPHGIKWLSERIEALGLGLGLWMAPYSISAFSPLAQDRPDLLIHGGGGSPLQQGTWFWEPHGDVYVLDLTHPEAQEWLRSSIAQVGNYGITYLKTDFIGNVHSSLCRHRYNPRIVAGGGLEAGCIGAQIIVEALPPGTLLLNCNGLEFPGLGRYQLLYTCYDTGNTGHVGWRHLRETYNTVACHLYKHRRWGIIQPSCLCVGLPGTLDEARVRATATFLCGGQVDISDDLTTLPAERWQVLEATLPPLGIAARPVDLFESDDARIWHVRVPGKWEAWDLVGLFNVNLPPSDYNYGSKAIGEFDIPLETLGLDPDRTYWAYEFWGGQFLGEVGGTGEQSNGATEKPRNRGTLKLSFFGPTVKLIAIRPARRHPWIVGTGFHQSNGTELTNVVWDHIPLTLSGEVRRPAGQSGQIVIACPAGYVPSSCTVAGVPTTVHTSFTVMNQPSFAGIPQSLMGGKEGNENGRGEGLRAVHLLLTTRQNVTPFSMTFDKA